MSPWTEPAEVVPAEALGDLPQRWRRLAEQYPHVVQVLEPGEAGGGAPPEDSTGFAPALAEVVRALPGVTVGPVVVDWPAEASQGWPELGDDRFGYQPVWVDGRRAVVVRVGADGTAGEVLHVSGEGGVDLEAGGVFVAADDVVAWWEDFTGWVEETLPALQEELAAEVEDPDELAEVLGEAIDQDFSAWLLGEQA